MTIQTILKDINEDFFLNDLSDIELMIKNGFIDKESIDKRWLGYEPVSEEKLLLKEQQLGVTLPHSYKEFLLLSNGFKFISPLLDNLLPIEKADWAKNTEGESWSRYEHYESGVSDDKYFDYSEEQDTIFCRDEYLYHSLKISDWCDGMCIFLNPVVKYDNEWEVLEYATWYPGTRRYKSFKDFLIETHKYNLNL